MLNRNVAGIMKISWLTRAGLTKGDASNLYAEKNLVYKTSTFFSFDA